MKRPTCDCIENRIKELQLEEIEKKIFHDELDVGYYWFCKDEGGYGISLPLNFCPNCGAPYKEQE